MKRKVALVGCREGSWIRTFGMQSLTLDAKVREDTMLKILQRDGTDIQQHVFVGPGRHNLREAEWTQVFIAEGHHVDALCLLVGA